MKRPSSEEEKPQRNKLLHAKHLKQNHSMINYNDKAVVTNVEQYYTFAETDVHMHTKIRQEPK